jgi:hypothetical protein
VAEPAVQESSSVVVDSGNASIMQAVNKTNGLYAMLMSGFINDGTVTILWMKFDSNAQGLLHDWLNVSNGEIRDGWDPAGSRADRPYGAGY